MGNILKNTAQAAMDLYYGDYKPDDAFFTKQDFVTYCGNTVTDLILQEYRMRRQENRQEKRDEVVPFSAEWMFEEVLDVKNDLAELSQRVMSFPYDRQGSGVQDVIAIKPRNVTMERSNVEEDWSLRYMPQTDRIFWKSERGSSGKGHLSFFRNGVYSVSQVKVRYVPKPNAEMDIPDSIENYVITTTIMNMKQIESGVIIDKTADGNPNKILQTELNIK